MRAHAVLYFSANTQPKDEIELACVRSLRMTSRLCSRSKDTWHSAGKKAQAGGKARLAGSTLKARGGTSKPRPKGPAKPRKPAAKKASKSKG